MSPFFLSQALDVDIKDRRRVSQPADSVREFYGIVTINQIQINVDISFFQERWNRLMTFFYRMPWNFRQQSYKEKITPKIFMSPRLQMKLLFCRKLISRKNGCFLLMTTLFDIKSVVTFFENIWLRIKNYFTYVTTKYQTSYLTPW